MRVYGVCLLFLFKLLVQHTVGFQLYPIRLFEDSIYGLPFVHLTLQVTDGCFLLFSILLCTFLHLFTAYTFDCAKTSI